MTEKALVPRTELELIGKVADEKARKHAFTDYQRRKSKNTLIRQRSGLALFAEYLAEAGVEVGELATDPEAWRGITFGLVEGFVSWMLQAGYALSTVNVRLSTVKTYAGLAVTAGVVTVEQYSRIKLVRGYAGQEARHMDARRQEADIPTRYVKPGAKKQPITLARKQIRKLKNRPDTPQGRRDRVMLGLMLDLGLRVGEVALLKIEDFSIDAGEVTFYRPKVDKEQTHSLDKNGLLEATRQYLEKDAPDSGPLLKASNRKGGLEDNSRMTERAITGRVQYLGRELGLDNLSAHDLRHTWATQAAKRTPIDKLMEAGGWSSPAMPLRYIAAARIANIGVILPE